MANISNHMLLMKMFHRLDLLVNILENDRHIKLATDARDFAEELHRNLKENEVCPSPKTESTAVCAVGLPEDGRFSLINIVKS